MSGAPPEAEQQAAQFAVRNGQRIELKKLLTPVLESGNLQVMKSRSDDCKLPGASGLTKEREAENRMVTGRRILNSMDNAEVVSILDKLNLHGVLMEASLKSKSLPNPICCELVDATGGMPAWMSRVRTEDNFCLIRSLSLAILGSEMFTYAMATFIIQTALSGGEVWHPEQEEKVRAIELYREELEGHGLVDPGAPDYEVVLGYWRALTD